MPRYYYIAKYQQGEEKSGEVDAKSSCQLARTLKEQGFILIKAESKSDKEKKPPTKFWWGVGGVSLTEKLMFTRNLQVMITSGLPCRDHWKHWLCRAITKNSEKHFWK